MDYETTGTDIIGSINTQMSPETMEILNSIGAVANLVSIIFFLASAYGLYLINKKLWEKHPWLSFVPLLQIYNYFTASKKSFLHYFVFPVIAIILWSLLAFFTFAISLIVAYVYMMIMWILLLHAISQRCGRWAWTTVGFVFIPFIMFPVVGVKLDETLKAKAKDITEKTEDIIV